VKGLNEIPGFSVKMPKGAFYAFPNVKGVHKSSKELTDYLLNEAGVCTLSGTAFGGYGEGYMRFSYATSKENIVEGLKRVKTAIEKII